VPIPAITATTSPSVTTFAIVVALFFSTCWKVKDILVFLRSSRVAISICAMVKAIPTSMHTSPSRAVRDVNITNTIEATITDAILIAQQKITFAVSNCDAFIGNVFCFNSVVPSLVTLVEQNVLVSTPNTNTTNMANAKDILIPNIFIFEDTKCIWKNEKFSNDLDLSTAWVQYRANNKLLCRLIAERWNEDIRKKIRTLQKGMISPTTINGLKYTTTENEIE